MACTYSFILDPFGPVDVLITAKARRIRLVVRYNGEIRVSAPPSASKADIQQFVSNNKIFIKDKLDYFASLKGTERQPILFQAGTVFKTHFHTIVFCISDIKERMRLEAKEKTKTIQVLYPADNDVNTWLMQKNFRHMVDSVLRFEAEEYLPMRLCELSEKFGISYDTVAIRNMKSQWGSCSSRKRICLNVQLMRLPFHLIDYVILHELAHIGHMNHQDDFYNHFNAMLKGRGDEFEKEFSAYSTSY